MTPLIIMAVAAGLPVLLAIVLRVSALFLYLSLAAGFLLLQFLGDDAGLAARVFVRGPNVPMIAQFTLLFLPVVLTFLFMRRSMPASKLLFHIVPLIAISLAGVVITLPLLASPVQQQIFANQYGNVLKNSQDIAVGIASILTLLLMWATYRHKESKKGKHK